MSKRKKSKLSPFFTILIIGLSIYFVCTVIDQQKILYSKNNELKNVQTKIAEENKLHEELKNQKGTIESDEYLERIAREKLGMVKRDEKVFVDVNK